MTRFATLPPLSLYIHFPWCARKCPYCDFNSHPARDGIPAAAYVDALIEDLDGTLPAVWGRSLVSIFMGGGTPSLFPPEQIERLLSLIRARLPLPADAEITMEANPGAVERGRFADYRDAGVSRLSMGVQSLDDECLQRLGRIHTARDAIAAYEEARTAGFASINLDLMFALPGQTAAAAASDLNGILRLEPDHISYYQLTLEPNTAFFAAPPPLPEDTTAAAIQASGQERLAKAGFLQYEVSAYAREGQRCRHNLNYWRFGDYLGIGAGAHGKISDGATGRIVRTRKRRHPRDYMAKPSRSEQSVLASGDIALEFMMNGLRLTEGFETGIFEQRTGLSLHSLEAPLRQAEARGLLRREEDRIIPTELGRCFLEDLLVLFVDAKVYPRHNIETNCR